MPWLQSACFLPLKQKLCPHQESSLRQLRLLPFQSCPEGGKICMDIQASSDSSFEDEPVSLSICPLWTSAFTLQDAIYLHGQRPLSCFMSFGMLVQLSNLFYLWGRSCVPIRRVFLFLGHLLPFQSFPEEENEMCKDSKLTSWSANGLDCQWNHPESFFLYQKQR